MSECRFCGSPTRGHRSCCAGTWSCRFKMLEQLKRLRAALQEIAAFDDSEGNDLDDIAVDSIAIAKIAVDNYEGGLGNQSCNGFVK